jgi:hypothetical protein
MSALSFFRTPVRATVRVDADAGPALFDALVIIESTRHGMVTRALQGERTPFVLALPDQDVTVIIRPRDPARPVTAEYARERGGRRLLWGRSWDPSPVLRRRGRAILCAGVPGESPGGDGDAQMLAPTV